MRVTSSNAQFAHPQAPQRDTWCLVHLRRSFLYHAQSIPLHHLLHRPLLAHSNRRQHAHPRYAPHTPDCALSSRQQLQARAALARPALPSIRSAFACQSPCARLSRLWGFERRAERGGPYHRRAVGLGLVACARGITRGCARFGQ